MRRLKLDFLHPFRARTGGLAAAGHSLGLAAWIGWQDQQVVRALAVAAAESPAPRTLLQPGVPCARQRARRKPALRNRTCAAGDALGELFRRLESNRPARIALLSLDADTRKSEATLNAEARSVKDMLAWIDQLKDKADSIA